MTYGKTSTPSRGARAIIVQIIGAAESKADRFPSAKVIALGWPAAVPDDRAMIFRLKVQCCRGSAISVRRCRLRTRCRLFSETGGGKESSEPRDYRHLCSGPKNDPAAGQIAKQKPLY